MHPITVNLVSKESDSVAEKLTFAQFQVKPILTQPVQHCRDVPQVGSLVRAMNQDIIHVHFNKWEPVKHRCHHPLEGTGCIGQTHRHDQPFVVSILCPKRGTLYTVRGHAQLPVAGTQVERREHSATGQRTHEIPRVRQRKHLPDCHLIELPVVHAHPDRAIRLFDNDHRTGVRTLTWPYAPSLQ